MAGEWPNRRPVRRALRWDGLYPIGLPGPEALAELVGEIRPARPADDPFDVVVGVEPGDEPIRGRGQAQPGRSPTSACSRAWPGCAR